MQRYFIRQDQLNENKIRLEGNDAHHVINVMRMKPEDHIYCCTPDGKTANCKIEELSNDEVTVLVVEWIDENKELPVSVTIAQGLPKGDKLELIVQKGTELGAGKFLPFFASRSIVKWDEKKGRKKTERLQKIAKEAAEQSHRSQIPEVLFPFSFKELIQESASYDLKILAYEESAKSGELSNLVTSLQSTNRGSSIMIAIGPEGGFADHEVEALSNAGFISCGLGPRILRTETAAMYFLSVVSYQFELLR